MYDDILNSEKEYKKPKKKRKRPPVPMEIEEVCEHCGNILDECECLGIVSI